MEQNEEYRVESDLLDRLQVPVGAYYGIQVQRAINNYHISNTEACDHPQFIVVTAYVKKAAAAVSAELSTLDKNIVDHICQAADDTIGGKLWDSLCTDMIQGRAGISVNINVDEAIANRTLELMEYEKGDCAHCYPDDHVNCGQFTNDVYPTPLRYAAHHINKDLLKNLKVLVDCLHAKTNELEDAVKMGRTQLQDAAPMMSGQEFVVFINTLEDELEYIEHNARELLTINVDVTVIGTGLNAAPGYADLVTEYLTKFTDDKFVKAKGMIAATPGTGDYVNYSGALKRLAIKLSRICNDLRLMVSGPRCGLYEISLPPMASGSSIMPGKVNPVIPEITNQVYFKVTGNDMAITIAAETGQLRLDAIEPVVVECVLESITWMISVMNTFREKCVSGIILNEKRNPDMVKHPIGIVTMLSSYTGYENSTKVVRKALEIGKNLHEIAVEKNLTSTEEVDKILDPKTML